MGEYFANEIVQSWCGKGWSDQNRLYWPWFVTVVWYLSESQTMYLQATFLAECCLLFDLPIMQKICIVMFVSFYLFLFLYKPIYNVYGFTLPCRCQETHLDPHPLSVLWSPNVYGTVVLPGLPKIQRQPTTMPKVFLEETVWHTCLQFKLRIGYQL